MWNEEMCICRGCEVPEKTIAFDSLVDILMRETMTAFKAKPYITVRQDK